MFEKHFHFHTPPFAEHTAAERLWPDDRLTQGLARVRYLTAAGTLGLVTGASGVGKSALLKRVWHELRGPGIQVYYLHLAQLSSNDLLRVLVRTLGETPLWSKDQLLSQIRWPVSRRYWNCSADTATCWTGLATACLLQAAVQNPARVDES